MSRPGGGALLALAAGLLAASTAASAPPRQAVIALESERPVVVSGRRFAPRESVSVTLSAGRTWTRQARADASGRLRVRFAAGIPRCTRYAIRAWGSTGTRAFFMARVMLDCEPGD